MQIPLDYYRILSVPVGATREQLEQAYQDHSLQIPRQEYSDGAIAARQELIGQAYEVLRDPERRADYDAKFLQNLYPVESSSSVAESSVSTESTAAENPNLPIPYLDLSQEQLIGALLILQELGEYELVLDIGQSYLHDLDSDSEIDNPENYRGLRQDIVLTLALACLELGIERWRQKAYEKAAAAWQMGQDLLGGEASFSSINEEIEAELSKLRPYRILNLLGADGSTEGDRSLGLQLLQEMLAERNGIDGTAEDGSGLSIDEFLQFIQQLRKHLTTSEQLELFAAEAKRPSAVATYLTIYALIAEGFAYRNPASILQAKEMLASLNQRQDVYLEQAVCAMLLGQTEQASYNLEQSQEHETLAFIREQSQSAPDLLPGLCLYAERWLQSEVFAHFRDLITKEVSLTEYFADPEVETYLEQLSEAEDPDYFTQVPPLTTEEMVAAELASAIISQPVTAEQESVQPELVGTATRSTTMTVTAPPSFASRRLNEQRDRPKKSSDEVASRSRPPSKRDRRRGRVPLQDAKPETIQQISQAKSKDRKVKIGLLLVAIAALVGTGIAAVAYYAYSWVNREPQLAIELNQPPVAIPSLENQPTNSTAQALDRESARAVIQTWLDAKSQAFGTEHQLEQLGSILAPPLLARWRNQAQALQGANAYRQYQHSINVQSVEVDPQNADQATVEATVREIAQHYQNGQLIEQRSYDDNLLVRYDLIRPEEQWQIKNINVVQ